jgi:hypothetical protein
VPIVTYGEETWTLTKTDISRLAALEVRFLRKLEGKTKRERIRSKKIRKNVKANTSEGKLTNSRIRWYRHVLRMNDQRIP